MNRSRRNFLIGMPVLLAGVAAYRNRNELSQLFPGDQSQDKVLSFITHPVHVTVIGKAYLFQYPEVSTDEILMAQLKQFLAIDSWSISEQEIEQALLESIQNDYKKNQTVVLDGWVLSRTEATVAGLLAVTGKY